MKQYKISVVAPAFNEEDYIVPYLESLSRQTILPFEVILVDNASTDNTQALARGFAAKNNKLNLKIVDESRKGIKYAREAGWRNSSGEIIAMTDVDQAFPNDWLYKINEAFEKHKDVSVVAGKYEYLGYPFLLRFFIQTFNDFYWMYLQKYILGFKACAGGNTAYKREVFETTGGYLQEEHDTIEDIYFSKRIHEFGFKVLQTTSIMVYHSIRRYEQEGMKGVVEWSLGTFNLKFYKEKSN